MRLAFGIQTSIKSLKNKKSPLNFSGLGGERGRRFGPCTLLKPAVYQCVTKRNFGNFLSFRPKIVRGRGMLIILKVSDFGGYTLKIFNFLIRISAYSCT